MATRPFLRSAFVLALVLSACAQDNGDVCQLDSDCDDGLKCDIAGNDALRGRCVPVDQELDAGDMSDDEDDAGSDLYDEGGVFDDAGA